MPSATRVVVLERVAVDGFGDGIFGSVRELAELMRIDQAAKIVGEI